jgi:hypothetical protein
MRGLRPSLLAAGSLLAAALALWLVASALLGFHAWPGGPAEDAPGVARLPAVKARASKPVRARVETRRRPQARGSRGVVTSRRRGRAPRVGASPSPRATTPRVAAPASPPAASPSPAATAATTSPPAATPPGPVARAVATVTAPVASVIPAPVQTVVADTAATVDGLLGGR